jgi:hypothetical protein
VQLCRDRRTSEERLVESRAAADLSNKLQVADEKRTVQISCIKDKARSYNERVSKRVSDNSMKQQTEVVAKKAELDEKLKKASERHEAQLESVKQTAVLSAQVKTPQSPQKNAAKVEAV